MAEAQEGRRTQPSPEEQAAFCKYLEKAALRQSLTLSKERVLRDIECATHPRHKEQLNAGLAYLEAQLANLEKEDDL